MFKKLVLITVTLCLSQFTLAAFHPKPDQCPNISVIQAEGLSQAEAFKSNYWGAFQISSYRLKELWAFIIIPIEANNEHQAIQKGNETLQNVSGAPSPQSDADDWFCEYHAPGDYYAIAVANPYDLSPTKIAHKFNRS